MRFFGEFISSVKVWLSVIALCSLAISMAYGQSCPKKQPQFPQWRLYLQAETGTLVASDQGGEVLISPLNLGLLLVPPKGQVFAQAGVVSQIGLEESPLVLGPYLQVGKYLNNKLRDHRWYVSLRAQGTVWASHLFPYNRELLREQQSLSGQVLLSYVFPLTPSIRMSWSPLVELFRIEQEGVLPSFNAGVNVGFAFKL